MYNVALIEIITHNVIIVYSFYINVKKRAYISVAFRSELIMRACNKSHCVLVCSSVYTASLGALNVTVWLGVLQMHYGNSNNLLAASL